MSLKNNQVHVVVHSIHNGEESTVDVYADIAPGHFQQVEIAKVAAEAAALNSMQHSFVETPQHLVKDRRR